MEENTENAVKVIINGVEYETKEFAVLNFTDTQPCSYRFGLNKSYNEMLELFHDDMEWSIKYPDGTIVECNEINIIQTLFDNRDGNVVITMRPETDLEKAYELLYGGM